jgi:dTDP-4-amino-4,6-dideoxy-D-glucose acyltransferase
LEVEVNVWLTQTELETLGFKSFGSNLLIDSRAVLFNPHNISIGDNCRIDAFVILSAANEDFIIGKNVHIGHASRLYGSSGIIVDDFASVSSGVALFTQSDSYSTAHLNNPTVPAKLRKIISGPIHLGKASLVGAHSVVLPGIKTGVGSSIGALSLVNRDVPEGWIVAGSPAKKIGTRDASEILSLIEKFDSGIES